MIKRIKKEWPVLVFCIAMAPLVVLLMFESERVQPKTEQNKTKTCSEEKIVSVSYDEYKKRHEDLADQNCVVLVIQCGVDDDF